MSIRSTSKAIIIHQGKVLLNRCYDIHNGEYYSLPGGGQNTYETMTEAVVRECLEETGYTVTPIRLAAVCEEICEDEEIRRTYPDYAHKMLHIFLCGLAHEGVQEPTEKDIKQVGIEWIELDRLQDIRLLPNALGMNITQVMDGTAPVLLGSEHIPFNHG